MNSLTSDERIVLEKLLRVTKRSTNQMIETCENILNNKSYTGNKERVRSTQKRFQLDLSTIVSLEEKLFGEVK